MIKAFAGSKAAALALAGALIVACSDPAGDDAGTVAAACVDCIHPPVATPDAPPGDGSSDVYAMSHIYLGDRELNGNESSIAWKKFGYDIDGHVSDKDSTLHCKVSNPIYQTDGVGGIDNSFGASVLPGFDGLAADMPIEFNDGIMAGNFTYLIRIDGIGTSASYNGLAASFYAAAPLGNAPNWDGDDTWPIRCESMTTCLDAKTPQMHEGNEAKAHFPDSYVVDGTWVSNPPGEIELGVLFVGSLWRLPLRLTRMTIDLAEPMTKGVGVISGVMETEEAIGTLRKIAGNVSTALCEQEVWAAFEEHIRAASDIMVDGTQDPGATCNAISFGARFDVRPAQLGSVLDAQPSATDPCVE